MSERVFSDMCTQWKFRSAWAFTVWSDSSMGTFWLAKDAKFPHAANDDSDQTAHIFSDTAAAFYYPWPSCTKLNETDIKISYLKYGKYIDIFCWKKCEQLLHCKSYSHFCSKNINVFENALATIVNKFVINEHVKLTMLWRTGPWCRIYTNIQTP